MEKKPVGLDEATALMIACNFLTDELGVKVEELVPADEVILKALGYDGDTGDKLTTSFAFRELVKNNTSKTIGDDFDITNQMSPEMTVKAFNDLVVNILK